MRDRLRIGGEGTLTRETVSDIHEQMSAMGFEGYEPLTEEEMKPVDEIDPSNFPIPAQCALILFNVLPDRIEGMNGIWLGKDFTGLKDIMNLYEMEDQLLVFELLLECINEASVYYADRAEKDLTKLNNK